MRRLFTCCCAVLLAVGAAAAHGQSKATSPKSLTWAERMFAQLEYDFGVVTRGADARHRIAITNPFGEPITLQSAKSTCGCVTPELSTNVLQPNETGHLELRLNTVKFTGHKNPTIDVVLSFGAGAKSTVRIPVHAYIRGDVSASEDVVDFGVVGAGQTAARTLTVTYHGSAPWRITGVRNNGEGVTVEIADPVRTSQGTVYKLHVTLGSDLPVGTFERSLVVLTEEPARSYLTMRVRAAIEPKIVVANPVIQLGAVEPGAKMTTRLIVRGREPFSLEAVQGTGGMATADLSKMSDKSVHVVPLTITVPSVPGRFTEDVLIKVAGETTPLACRVEGEVLGTRGSGNLTRGAAR